KFKYFVNSSLMPTRNLDLKFTADVYSKVMPLFKKLSWINYYENAISTLFTKKDRTDYYFGTGFKFRIDYRVSRQITLAAEFHQEKQSTLTNNTNFAFFRKYDTYTPNPPVNDG